jgi:hypothetical protein
LLFFFFTECYWFDLFYLDHPMAAMVFDSETRVEIEKIATKTKQQTGAFFFFFF